jgi:hypothetical protein
MTLVPARVWSQEQWERIERGYRAGDMDEKWDVFVENRVAFLHRSWTGNGAFEASFSPVDGGWRISAGVAETSPERVRKVSAELNRVLLELVLSAVVLGEPAVGLRRAGEPLLPTGTPGASRRRDRAQPSGSAV